MIEVLFGESEAASMKMAKGRRTVVGGAGKAENGSGTWIGGHPRQVICLGFMLDIGDIKEPVDGRYRRELIRAMYGQEQWGKQGEGAGEPEAAADPYTAELERLAEYIGQGEPVRIWYSDSPYSRCGFYFLCGWLKPRQADVRVVKLPEYVQCANVIRRYQNWGEIGPEEFAGFLSGECRLSHEEQSMYANAWSRLVEDNSPLRAVINGKMTGVPVTSIFAGVFERLGFTVRLPYTFTGVIGNPASLSAGEKLTRLVRRIWGMAVLPLGEDMDHVIIAWGTGLITLLSFLWVCWLIGFVRTGGMKGRRGFASGEHAASSASLQPFCEVLLLPALGLACIYSVYTLSQVDGNYFVLFYTLLITGVSGIRCRHGRKTDLERNLSGLLAPLAVAGLFITCCTSWAGARGFTPVSLNHPGWYDHRSEVRERQAEAGISEIVSALTPRSRVVAFGEHPQVLDLPCSVQSYYDITGSGGNVYLVKKLDYFKWYLDISGTEYIFVETGYGDRQSRAGEMIRYMIEDNSLTDLVYENGNLLGRVQLGGPDSDGNPYDRQRIGREFAENFYQYMGK